MALPKSPVLRGQSVSYGLQSGDKGFQFTWVVPGYLEQKVEEVKRKVE